MKIDGVLGPVTLSALSFFNPTDTYNSVLSERIRFLISLVTSDPAIKRFRKTNPTTQLENLKGWMNRMMEFL